MKKIIFTIFVLTFINFPLFVSFALPTTDTDYYPLVPEAVNRITGGSSDRFNIGSLGEFLGKTFSFGIALAAALAVFMIIFGGIQYMTTDAWTKKEDGKKKIENALYGLGLALISWMILWIINPCLVDFAGCGNTILK